MYIFLCFVAFLLDFLFFLLSVMHSCVCLVAKSCPTLCNPVDCSQPGSSICGISRARTPEWVAISFSRRPSRPRGWTQVSCIAGRFFTAEPPGVRSWFLLNVAFQLHVWTNCIPQLLDIWVVPTYWLFSVMLLRTFTCSFCADVCFPSSWVRT